MQQSESPEEPNTLTDSARVHGKGILDPIGRFLNRLGFTPNMLTLTGLVGNIVGAVFLSRGEMLIGGLIILAMGPIDALDGTIARIRGEPSKFGAFVDSITDRYSELVIFFGLLLYYIQHNNYLAATLVYAAAVGSVMVSYVRARAETLDYNAKVGLLTRMERYIVLVPALILNRPIIALWIIAILANATAFHRIIHVRSQAQAQGDILDFTSSPDRKDNDNTSKD